MNRFFKNILVCGVVVGAGYGGPNLTGVRARQSLSERNICKQLVIYNACGNLDSVVAGATRPQLSPARPRRALFQPHTSAGWCGRATAPRNRWVWCDVVPELEATICSEML
jgi:hypothetical protein